LELSLWLAPTPVYSLITLSVSEWAKKASLLRTISVWRFSKSKLELRQVFFKKHSFQFSKFCIKTLNFEFNIMICKVNFDFCLFINSDSGEFLLFLFVNSLNYTFLIFYSQIQTWYLSVNILLLKNLHFLINHQHFCLHNVFTLVHNSSFSHALSAKLFICHTHLAEKDFRKKKWVTSFSR